MLEQATLSDEVIKKKSKIKCEVCGKEFEVIASSHLKTHGITMCEYREQFPNASLVSEGFRKKMSEVTSGENNGMHGHEHTPESKQLMRDNSAMKGKHPHLTDVHKQKIGEAVSGEKNGMFGKLHTEATRQLMSDNNVGMKGKCHTEESKQKNREAHLGTHPSEPTRQLMSEAHSGEKNYFYGKGYLLTDDKNPNYKDGTSNFPYCPKFNDDLKERVRDFFGRCCYLCGKSEQKQIDEMIKEGKRPVKVLDVHHVNFDKMVCCNDVKPLFVPLCRSCHVKTNGNRKYWEEFFTISLKCLTKGKCFLPKKVDSLLNGEKEK